MSDGFRVRNWEKWQSYRRDRGQPPWIKVHREVMRNPDWVSMTDAQRGQLVSLWLLAADKDGKLPACPRIIKKLCYMDEEPDLQLFVSLGFIEGGPQGDDAVTSTRRQGDQPETEAEAETEKKKPMVDRWPTTPPKKDGQYEYPEEFEQAWEAYPSRDGPNPKTGAYKAFRARVKAGDDPVDLAKAAEHYRQHCQYREKEGTPYVQQAATFYGPSEPWREFLGPETSPNGSHHNPLAALEAKYGL